MSNPKTIDFIVGLKHGANKEETIELLKKELKTCTVLDNSGEVPMALLQTTPKRYESTFKVKLTYHDEQKEWYSRAKPKLPSSLKPYVFTLDIIRTYKTADKTIG